ncbi:serine/threonine-protein kinase [Amycolatopsis bartoniae]|uniref:non-specific serine/threonine protein kinase n=1 Tax=Amycolatopsis bartoniae TaxID=941986 RepID=A0A8H9M8G3_9PSEU|nr:serine/threonine-protein kinase [Amycolatopsis bartoniae]MBB2938343.1 serine/threonine-protein kinase [Amycolatopsis bartoniae]TVT01805.1 serine/threonine protein kinase [Amycolatopsis bartoniae]GHF34481.1 hypothetical protein GCM10017566_03970 [Amycolatopsis bartoniae]
MAAETFGPYRIEELLGRGGMGEVHRAYDTVHERVVALKRLSEPYGDDAAYRARFRRESQIVARLSEPHVIPIHAFGEIDGRLYLDMRVVEGVDLKDLMAGGPLPPRRAVGLLAQVASALDAAHADGLVHRDVKPSNILVAPGDFVYLVDFGIARSMGPEATSITLSGDVIGTLDYMAPERFGDRPVDGRVDVYALACVLFACLTGSRPFAQTEPAAQVRAHLQDQPPAASVVNPALPRAVDAVLWRGMAKNPDERFPTAGALMAAAEAALAAPAPPVPVVAPVTPPTAWLPPPQTGWAPPPPAPARTNRTPWLVAGAAVVVIAAVATVLLILRSGSGDDHNAALTTGPASSSASPTPTPSSSAAKTSTQATPGDQETQLLQHLPDVYRGNASCRADDGYRQPGTQAAVLCTQPNSQSPYFDAPSEAYFYSFADRAGQDAFFQQLVSTRGLQRDDGRGGCAPLKRTGIYGLYYRDESGPVPGEYVTCFVQAGAGQLWWVDTRTLTVGELSSASADTNEGLDKLYTWWNEMVLVTMK